MPITITKDLYDIYATKSFFVDNNFSGRYAPSNISSNMIDCENLKEFHYQTSFFLHFYSSLYIKLQDYQSNIISYNVSKFANTIENMGIKIDNSTSYVSGSTYLADFSSNASSGDIRYKKYDFTFYVKSFEGLSITDYTLNIFNPASSASIINKSKPNFGSYANTLNISDSYTSNLIIKSTGSNLLNTDILERANTLKTLPESSKIIKDVNTSKFKEIIEEIFSQKPENIIGYLLYKKIYYNIILYNIAIQNSIRSRYLNIAKIANFDSDGTLFSDSGINYATNIKPVITQITLNTENINELSRSHFVSENNDFLLEKNEYRNKINALNTLKEEYNKIQDKLNISTKLYNQQFKNYKTIKFYATYVIIALIIIIILTISLSIFPIFSVDVKNSIYIISLIVLIVITYLYYTNFKYVNLYEKFFDYSSAQVATLTIDKTIISTCPSSNILITDFLPTNPSHRANHAKFYTQLLPAINQYNNAYNDLMNNIRMNIYTIGSKTFSQDANIYLYNLYLEKKRQNENNKIKYTNLFNMIEIIKKQINFLFNIVFILGCFCIILLLGLVLYSTTPELYIFIIILCVILISILMIYFGFAIIQPTRMIVNKNYWAIVNPSKTAISKL